MTQRPDVVVIGGGIVGAACAYSLCAEGLKVHLMERHYLASGTSRAGEGLILHMDKALGPELALAQMSANLWREWSHDLEMGFDYVPSGSIFVAEGAEGLASCARKAHQLRAAGIRLEILDGTELRSLESNLAPDLPGGVLCLDDAAVDPRRATLSMLSAAREKGLLVETESEVVAIGRDGRGDGPIRSVRTRKGEIGTEAVVCAAGVWSGAVARMVNIELPTRPRKGHILVTTPIPGFLRHPLMEGGYVSTVQQDAGQLQVALVAEMTVRGTLLLGSSREFAGFDTTVSLAVLQAIAGRAVRFLPSLAKEKVMRSYAGLRPWSPDHLPLIGPVSAVPGFYLATGHEGAGIDLAPITGSLMVQWITGRDAPPAAHAVRPDRLLGSP
jgi:D-hydroxyproline dehydrogenase subunit beta